MENQHDCLPINEDGINLDKNINSKDSDNKDVNKNPNWIFKSTQDISEFIPESKFNDMKNTLVQNGNSFKSDNGIEDNYNNINLSTNNNVRENDNEHVVNVHVAHGSTFSVQLQDKVQIIHGPATVRVVSHNFQPTPMSMPLPPGNIVQPVIDENGVLTDLFLTPQQGSPMSLHSYQENFQHGGQFMPKYSQAPFPMNHRLPIHQHSIPQQHQNSYMFQADSNSRTEKRKMRLQNKLMQKRENSTDETDSFNSAPVSHIGLRDSRISNNEEEYKLEEKLEIKLDPPLISDITPFTALICFPNIDLSDEILTAHVCIYRVFRATGKNDESSYKEVVKDSSKQVNLTNLSPATTYFIKYSVIINDSESLASPPESFSTLPTIPDIPSPPKILCQTKSTIQVKWNPVADNGSKITAYNLECDKGSGSFETVYNGTCKQFKLTKLNPGSTYIFRLAAVNYLGSSKFSSEVSFMTSGPAPLQPECPCLIASKATSLTLNWLQRPSDESFVLQMNDETTGHGFLPLYNGSDTSYTASKLKPNKNYKFRLQSSNSEGSSPWSETVVFETKPDQPKPPSRLQIKGKVTSQAFKIAWEEPSFNGGSVVTGYIVHLIENAFDMKFETSECEYLLTNLQPGNTYKIQIQTITAGGASEFSDILTQTTPPVCPGQCHPPRLQDKAKSTYVVLSWDAPSYTGGATISEFIVQVMLVSDEYRQDYEMLNSNDVCSDSREAYRGLEKTCMVAGLQPGRSYMFKVRAANKAGLGRWSEGLIILTGAAPPNTPTDLRVQPKSAYTILVTWSCPLSNGQPVAEYKLEMAKDEINNREEINVEVDKHSENRYQLIYVGNKLSYEVVKLLPVTSYSFRVQAINSIGQSPYSLPVSCQTLPGVPGPICGLSVRPAGSSELILVWKNPADHGSMIKNYLIEIGSSQIVSIPGDLTEYILTDLEPETSYKIRMQAVNSIGIGSFNGYVKATTKPMPPLAPTITCVQVGSKFLKLRWGNAALISSNIKYNLEMVGSRNKCQLIYAGPLQTFKVSKLNEATEYSFRISSSNESGIGPMSPFFNFSTCFAAPPAMKAPRISDITPSTCSLEWSAIKMNSNFSAETDQMEYELQLSDVDNNLLDQFVTIYRGLNTSFELVDLKAAHNYQLRIRGIRVLTNINQLRTSSTCSFDANNLDFDSIDFNNDSVFENIIDNNSKASNIINVNRIKSANDSKDTHKSIDNKSEVDSKSKKSVFEKTELVGAFSGLACFTTIRATLLKANDVKKEITEGIVKTQRWEMTEQRWAAVFMTVFLFIALIVAIVANQLLQR